MLFFRSVLLHAFRFRRYFIDVCYIYLNKWKSVVMQCRCKQKTLWLSHKYLIRFLFVNIETASLKYCFFISLLDDFPRSERTWNFILLLNINLLKLHTYHVSYANERLRCIDFKGQKNMFGDSAGTAVFQVQLLLSLENCNPSYLRHVVCS